MPYAHQQDRLGRVTSGVTDYGTGNLNITALAAYNALGEVVATCGPNAVEGGCTSANITTNSDAWHYEYDDAAGHQIGATAPDNSTATDLAETTATYDMDGAGRLLETEQGPRTTSFTYDDLGRTTQVSVATTGVGTLTTTSTLDGAGRTTQIATSGTSSDTLVQTYDALDRMTALSRGSNVLTSFTYNADGTAASRTDYDPTEGSHHSTFTYTDLGQLASASLPDGVGTTTYTWALDGNLLARTWGSYVEAAYSYDNVKRPTNMTLEFDGESAGSFSRYYDRASNAVTEGQSLPGAGSGLAPNSIASFE